MTHGADETRSAGHVPVLWRETLDLLDPRPGEEYIDCTVGGGGHSLGILERSAPDGRLLGIDADPEALRLARERLADHTSRIVLAHGNFGELETVARWNGFDTASGILFDLGVSSMELDHAERGFSFRADAPLDMRLDPTTGKTAADLVNELPEAELMRILFEYGEESRARPIVRAIAESRTRARIESTRDLAAIVERIVPGGRIHPATRTFQALRIAVNKELDVLAAALPQALELLRPGGRLVVISFHSLEDRIVKRFMVDAARGCICPPELPACVCSHRPTVEQITRKAVKSSDDEIFRNPRSRSARLRAVRKI